MHQLLYCNKQHRGNTNASLMPPLLAVSSCGWMNITSLSLQLMLLILVRLPRYHWWTPSLGGGLTRQVYPFDDITASALQTHLKRVLQRSSLTGARVANEKTWGMPARKISAGASGAISPHQSRSKPTYFANGLSFPPKDFSTGPSFPMLLSSLRHQEHTCSRYGKHYMHLNRPFSICG